MSEMTPTDLDGSKAQRADVQCAKAQRVSASSRARAVAFVGLSVAIIAVSAWVVIPLGPVPFTMQMFAIPLIIILLPAPQAIAAIFAYVVLGAIGVPVFSGMRGGFGVLMGPTGGFLLSYLVAVPVAAGFLVAMRRLLAKRVACADSSASASAPAPESESASASAPNRPTKRFVMLACEVAAGLIFTLIAYAGGCLQYSLVAGIGLGAAFATSVAPFILPDIAKVVLAAICAQPIKAAINLRR